MVLESDIYVNVLEVCNDFFGNTLKKYYTDFVVIGSLIISRIEVDRLVQLYRQTMVNHFDTLYQMLGYIKSWNYKK